MDDKNSDFTKGKISSCILRLVLPLTVAQFVNVLYSMVDRMYLGRLPEAGVNALTGVGVALPILTILTAFANLVGMGGTPLFSLERGRGNQKEAENILGNSFLLLLLIGIITMIVTFLIKDQLLFLFGASETTFSYANDYLSVYLIGNVFVMITIGMNGFINAQGFSRIGMLTVVFGAVANIILDPIFIFLLHMGVKGAAWATVLSQFFSVIWVMLFFTGKKVIHPLKRNRLHLSVRRSKKILTLGLAGFVMSLTNSATAIICNATLAIHGGDLYVGVMTVISSVREMFFLTINSLTHGSQPVLGYNYGAKAWSRVREGIRFITGLGFLYTFGTWVILMLSPALFIRLFNGNDQLIQAGVPAFRIYFAVNFMMTFQFVGQSVFMALGRAKQAIFFSTLRKAIIVIPLTLLLPNMFHLGLYGVFLAEPISQFIGATACYTTMLFTVGRELKKKALAKKPEEI